jgi:hypothetical protein
MSGIFLQTLDLPRTGLGFHGGVPGEAEQGAAFGFLITPSAVLRGKVSRRARRSPESRGEDNVGSIPGLLAFCSHRNGLSGIEKD